MNVNEIIDKDFGEKYNFLKVLSVVYDETASECVITFLYPYNVESLSDESKLEIENSLKNYFSLNANLKVKFKKSYLDEKLIVASIMDFFIENKKGLVQYISTENIHSSQNDFTVNVEIKLNQDVFSLIDDEQLSSEIKNYLNEFYIANFIIGIKESEDKLPTEIEAEDIEIVDTRTPRFKVNIDKMLIGSSINPMPEYIKNVKVSKTSVILYGAIKNLNRKSFIAKKGKYQGQERTYYTFLLKDDSKEIECIHFYSKKSEKIMEKLENLNLVLCVGDVQVGLNGRLSYHIKKMALASPYVAPKEQEKGKEEKKFEHHKVVFPDILPRKNQTTMFDQKPDYNDLVALNNIVVFDIETTGLDPERCEITELGAIKIEHGEITERFSSFAKPKHPIPDDVQELTHITNEMVADAPRIEDVVTDFYEWTRGCVLSGYNIVNFDIKFVHKVAERIGLNFDNEIVDTMVVVRKSGLRVPNYKLGSVVKTLGLTLEGAHRAYNDAYATAQVLLALSIKK